MNINTLIDKYGTSIQKNNETIRVYFDNTKATQVKRNNLYTSFNLRIILLKEEISLDDVFVIDGKEFLVLEVIDKGYVGNQLVYVEVALYENDFMENVRFFSQSLAMQGCNLPNADTNPYKEAKARIRTKKSTELLSLALQGQKVPTHEITIKYQDGISANDLIVWGDRSFEILSLQNLDEKNKFLVMDCIEVLNA